MERKFVIKTKFKELIHNIKYKAKDFKALKMGKIENFVVDMIIM